MFPAFDGAPRQRWMPFKKIVGQTARRLGYDLERPCRGEEMKPRLPECIEGQTSGKPARQKNAIADIE